METITSFLQPYLLNPAVSRNDSQILARMGALFVCLNLMLGKARTEYHRVLHRSIWNVCWHSMSFVAGTILICRQPWIMQALKENNFTEALFLGWNEHGCEDTLRMFFLLQIAFWTAGLLNTIKTRCSFAIVFQHAAIWFLAVLCYTVNFTRVGLLAFILQDLGEVSPNAKKACQLSLRQRAVKPFAILTQVTYYVRSLLFVFLCILPSIKLTWASRLATVDKGTWCLPFALIVVFSLQFRVLAQTALDSSRQEMSGKDKRE